MDQRTVLPVPVEEPPPIVLDGCCVPTGPSEPVPIEPLLPRLFPPVPLVELEEPEPVIDPPEVEPLVAPLLLSTPPMLPQPSWLFDVQGGLVWLELVVEPALLAAGLPEIEPLSAAKAGAAIRARAVAAPIIRLFMRIPFAVQPVNAGWRRAENLSAESGSSPLAIPPTAPVRNDRARHAETKTPAEGRAFQASQQL